MEELGVGLVGGAGDAEEHRKGGLTIPRVTIPVQCVVPHHWSYFSSSFFCPRSHHLSPSRPCLLFSCTVLADSMEPCALPVLQID